MIYEIWNRIKKILFASLMSIALIIGCAFIMLGVANFVEEAESTKTRIVLAIYSVVIIVFFCRCLIRVHNNAGESGTLLVVKDYPDKFGTVKHEFCLFWQREWLTVSVVWGILGVILLLSLLDGLFFQKTVITNIMFPFAPLAMLCTIFPGNVMNPLGYLVSGIGISLCYFLELTLLRRKWHKLIKKRGV